MSYASALQATHFALYIYIFLWQKVNHNSLSPCSTVALGGLPNNLPRTHRASNNCRCVWRIRTHCFRHFWSLAAHHQLSVSRMSSAHSRKRLQKEFYAKAKFAILMSNGFKCLRTFRTHAANTFMLIFFFTSSMKKLKKSIFLYNPKTMDYLQRFFLIAEDFFLAATIKIRNNALFLFSFSSIILNEIKKNQLLIIVLLPLAE